MTVVGVDEVGRGCLAGPVVVGAVLLGKPLIGIKDSKLLSKRQREAWVEKIEESALAIGLGWVHSDELDSVGLTEAVRLAMQRAVEQIKEPYDQIIIDGNFNFLAENPKAVCLIKADQTVQAVSAASVVAKVARDKFMTEMGTEYPHYGFEHNVGYGTRFHLERLQAHGISQLHRRSFAPIQALLQLPA